MNQNYNANARYFYPANVSDSLAIYEKYLKSEAKVQELIDKIKKGELGAPKG